MCQYIHKVSAASRDDPQQMVLASKLLRQERSCEFLARAKDQLTSIGNGPELDDSFESFNVMRSAKFNHPVREKGTEEKLSAAASTSPRVVVARPHPSINSKLAGPKVCEKKELLSERSLIELEAMCGTYFVPEAHPDNPKYAPDSAVARDYSLWLSTGDPAVLRRAYKEMDEGQTSRDVSDSFRFRFHHKPNYLERPTSVTRLEREVAAGFLAMAGVVLVSQWNAIKREIFGGGDSSAVVQTVNEDTRHIRILSDHVQWVERETKKMTTILGYTENFKHLEDQYDRLVALKGETFDQYSYMYAGIDQLLISSKLNSALIHPPFVTKALTRLTQRLRKNHQDLLIADYRDLYLLDTSFVLLWNYSLDLYVHIPVGDHTSTMRLFEYVPTPILLSSHPQLFSVEPYRIHLAVGDTQQTGYKELLGRDLRSCRVVKTSYFCPHQTVLGFDHGKSCLSAMYWGNEDVVRQTCPLKPIPHDEYFTQLSPTTFVLALSHPEMFRFSCGHSSVANLRLSGIVKITIPAGCIISGSVLTLSPTSEVHFDGGEVSTFPLKPARDIELQLVEFATNQSVYHTKSGIPGPSLEEASLKWKNHLLKVDTHWSLWAKVQAALGVLFGMVVLILVLKCYFTWQNSRSQNLARQELGELRENQAHLTTQLVATQGRAEMTEERLTHRMRSSFLERQKLELARATAGSRSRSLGMLAEGGVDEETNPVEEESVV